ncbi:Protein CBG26466 [Caenorhabditis briggsae]|nr:Protein CBG26466 [Caenorhabditis briggsae]CAR98743.1 Protein CBG26466 [Caenorhabditis briggsae]
MCVYKNV